MPEKTKNSKASEYKNPFLAASRAVLLQNKDYYFYLLHKIRTAQHSIYSTVFIIDAQPVYGGPAVRELLDALAYQKWLGLDTQVIIGHSKETMDIDLADRASFAYLESAQVPVRYAKPDKRSSLHSKYVIIDGKDVILGSHNWAYFDLFQSKQTSIAITSPDLAQRMTRRFKELWANSQEVHP